MVGMLVLRSIIIDVFASGYHKQKGYTITQTARFYPTYTTMSIITSEQYSILAAQDLVKALRNLKNPKLFQLTNSHKKELAQLAQIFNEALPQQDVMTLILCFNFHAKNL